MWHTKLQLSFHRDTIISHLRSNDFLESSPRAYYMFIRLRNFLQGFKQHEEWVEAVVNLSLLIQAERCQPEAASASNEQASPNIWGGLSAMEGLHMPARHTTGPVLADTTTAEDHFEGLSTSSSQEARILEQSFQASVAQGVRNANTRDVQPSSEVGLHAEVLESRVGLDGLIARLQAGRIALAQQSTTARHAALPLPEALWSDCESPDRSTPAAPIADCASAATAQGAERCSDVVRRSEARYSPMAPDEGGSHAHMCRRGMGRFQQFHGRGRRHKFAQEEEEHCSSSSEDEVITAAAYRVARQAMKKTFD
jgi:hypothetical protein